MSISGTVPYWSSTILSSILTKIIEQKRKISWKQLLGPQPVSSQTIPERQKLSTVPVVKAVDYLLPETVDTSIISRADKVLF